MKYSRLIAGIITLFSLLVFIGSTPSESEGCFNTCEDLDQTEWGYIEVWNDTAFHITVVFNYGSKLSPAYVIKHDPGMIQEAFTEGKVTVHTYIIDPILRTNKFHKAYVVNVGAGGTQVIRVKGGSLW